MLAVGPAFRPAVLPVFELTIVAALFSTSLLAPFDLAFFRAALRPSILPIFELAIVLPALSASFLAPFPAA